MKRLLSIVAVLMLAASTPAWAGGGMSGDMGGGMGGMGQLISDFINRIMGSGMSDSAGNAADNHFKRTNPVEKGFFGDSRELRRHIGAKEAAISRELDHKKLDRQKLIRLHMELLTLQQELDHQLDRMEQSLQQDR